MSKLLCSRRSRSRSRPTSGTIQEEVEVRALAAAPATRQVLGRKLNPPHPGALEERVGRAHGGDGFDVACLAMLADPANQRRAQAQGAELRVNDHAADRAHVAVGEAQVFLSREVAATEASLAGEATGGGIGKHADRDDAPANAGSEARCVADGPD